MDVFDIFSDLYRQEKQERLSIQDFLLSCRDDPMFYASASERMIAAIGDPEVVNTSSDPRLSRIFMNRTIKRYPAFKDFYGMEDTIERIVGFFNYAAQEACPYPPVAGPILWKAVSGCSPMSPSMRWMKRS